MMVLQVLGNETPSMIFMLADGIQKFNELALRNKPKHDEAYGLKAALKRTSSLRQSLSKFTGLSFVKNEGSTTATAMPQVAMWGFIRVQLVDWQGVETQEYMSAVQSMYVVMLRHHHILHTITHYHISLLV